MRRREFFRLGAGAVTAMGLTPAWTRAAAAQAKKVSIGVVVNTSDYKWIKLLLQQYEQKTGVKIEEFQYQSGDVIPKYTMAFEAKRPRFDVVMIWDFYMPQMVAGKYLLPLDGSADPKIKLPDEDRADYFNQSLRGVTFDGHLYGVPESLDAGMLYYRKDLFAEAGLKQPPRTWDELVEYAKKLTKGGQWGYAFIGAPGWTNTYTFFEFLHQAGGTFLDVKGAPAFNSEAGLKALQFMVDLRNKHRVVPPGINTYLNTEVQTGFLNGTFAMARHWPFLFGMAEFSEKWGAKSAVKGQTGYARLPYLVKDVAGFNNWAYCIPTIAENPQAGWDLIQFLTSKDSCLFEMLFGLDMTARQSIYRHPEVKAKMPEFVPFFDLFAGIMQTAVPFVFPEAAGVSEVMGQEIDKAMVGQITPKQALDAAAARVRDLVKR
jgi:multiple sugar transport system substrate-binding protein